MLRLGKLLGVCLFGALAISGIVFLTDNRYRVYGFGAALRTVLFSAAGISLLLAAVVLMHRRRLSEKLWERWRKAYKCLSPTSVLAAVCMLFMLCAAVLDLYLS